MNSEASSTEQQADTSADSFWNYHPDLPIQTGGIFRNITNPLAVAKGILLSWFGVYVRGLFLLMIAVLWFTVFPTIQTIGEGGWSWVLQIYLVNLVLMLCWAGGIHLYFYTFAMQGDHRQFDMNAMQKGGQFTFGGQVFDNMFWTLVYGVSIWTIYECGLLWLLSQELIPSHSWHEGPIWFVLLFLIIPFWDSVHFYFVHRLLHMKWMYKHFHSVHHRNISVGPWSGLSMHPVESAIYLSPVVIHLFLPSDPLHIVFHISWYAMGPATTHCGFEAMSIQGKNIPRLGDFFHVLHHRFYQCNYGNSEVPLDKLNGSFHDGTKQASRDLKARLRQRVKRA